LSLIYYSLVCTFTVKDFLGNYFSFFQLDQILSTIILFLILAFAIIKRRRWKVLDNKLNFSNTLIILLLFVFILSPLIAPFNPNFQLNLSVSKLLSPLSSKKIVELENEKETFNSSEGIQTYLQIKKELDRDVVDEFYFLADSVLVANDIKIFQKSGVIILPTEVKIKIKDVLFIFGTDEYGRDIFSRLIYATRLSLFIGFFAVVITFLLGLVLGFISGYFSKVLDGILNRFTEMLLSVPTIFLVILFLAMFGNSLVVVIILLGSAGWMSLFKIVRGEVISIKNKNFITSSKLIGMTSSEILIKDFLPLLIPSIIVNLVFQFANVIIAESALSFLGLTGNHLYPTWGAMIHQGQFYLEKAWWIALLPSLFLILTLIAIYGLGRTIENKSNSV
jgi:peptide/nickel transport system permease protein